MTLRLNKLKNFKGRPGPLLLIVMDGVGLTDPHPGNAVAHAHTPVLDGLLASPLSTQLQAHGARVGLPTDEDMGNSEVGHNALGAGRVIEQGASLVNLALESGALFSGEHWQKVEQTGLSGGTVHLLGLLSDGNVHAHIDHLFALLSRLQAKNVQKVRVHILLDGRDVSPRSALKYVAQLEEKLDAAKAAGLDYRIASGGGRQVITMDRYNANLAMVKEGYECHACGVGNKVRSAKIAIQSFYDNFPDQTDQDIPAFVVLDDDGKPTGKMLDGDAVVLFNFRGDRAMEISRALGQDRFTEFSRCQRPDFFFCSLIEYDGDLHIPVHFLVAPPIIKRTMVDYLCAEQQRMFAISETQKFGHMTYFWNGNRTGFICEEYEEYDEVKSDLVPFNQKPKMKAFEITDQAIYRLKMPGMRFGRLNFANGDMVGHTGDFAATIVAMETVDECMGQLIHETKKLGGIVLILADHGNAEEVSIEVNGQREMKTSHTLNPVPFAIVDAHYEGEYTICENTQQAGLVNVAATVFNLLGYEAPDEYEPSLIRFV